VHVKGILSLSAAIVAAIALVSSSGAGTASRGSARIDLATRASVVHYLRSIHVNPRGVVIQRGARNYAGPNCPGKGWACTSTAHPVVQVASAGGKNAFQCSAAHCAVVQAAQATAAANTAKCVRTTGVTQSCSINQVSSSGDNEAIVYMNVTKLTGLTQDSVQTAQIVQQALGGPSSPDINNNRACVTQYMRIDTMTIAKRGMPVLATLDGHQSLTINQDSRYGNNNASESANGSSGGSCGPFVDPYDPLQVPHPNINQLQIIKQTAQGSARIEQDENTHDQGANLLLDIKQNKNGGGLGPNNTNNAVFLQDNALTAIAKTPVGPVVQNQVTPNGGLTATVNQFAHGLSNADAHQNELQCEHATETGDLNCVTGGTVSYERTQTQFGQVKKGDGSSTQGDFSGDEFRVTQTSQQDNDTGGPRQQNLVQGDCSTTGTCIGHETVKAQTSGGGGSTTDNTQSGTGNVQLSIECTSTTSCTKRNSFPSGHVLVSVGNGLVQEWDVSGATPTLARTLDTTKGTGVETAGLAFDSAGTLYVADFEANDVSHFNGDATLFGSFGSGYNLDPESIVFDTSGNAYVGQADGDKTVLKFSPSGAPLASFSPATEDRGTDWVELAPDQCTLYYTSEGTSVKRFNVCTNTQLSDFATALPGTGFAVKLLSDGGALVADTDSIVRLDSSGNVVQQYGSGESQFGVWFSLALDPSGTAFWAGDVITGTVKKFDLSSGNELASFTTGASAPDAAGGLAVAP
jgi:hypothetical protein